MKCEECTTSALEELLDGELERERAAEMNAHLAACEPCALRYDELLDEQTIYASYERDVEVAPHLWAGVAATRKPSGTSSTGGRVPSSLSSTTWSATARWQRI